MDILGFLGSLFGQKKKQQPTTQSKPTATVARPVQAPVINTQQVQNTVRLPQPLIAPTQISTPSLGGITSTPNTGDVAQAQRIIQAGGAGAPASPAVIAAAKAAPVRPTVQAPQKSLLSAVQDFTAQANDELYGGLIKGGANIANSFATGFNQDETAKRTADFARTLGIDTGNGQSQTAAGTDRNSNAGQLGQAVGQVEKTVAENAPFIIAPGLGASAALPTRIAGGVATGVPTAFLQGAANNGSLQDDATSGIIGGATGGVLTGVAPLLGKVAGRILNRADNVPVKSAGPITSSPTTNKAPAITSPNREAAAAATIQQPAVVAPQETGIPSFEPPVVPVAEKPPVQIAPTPFGEPIVAPAPQSTAQTVDPRVTEVNSRADNLINDANNALKGEGSSYQQVVRKLYNNNRPDGVISELSPAERTVASKIQPELDATIKKLNKLGITDTDTGTIGDYLPTTKFDELGDINNVDDVARNDFGFTKRRGNKLDDTDVEHGAEQALRNYLRTGALADDLTPETLSKIKLARRDKEFTDLIETDSKGASTGLQASDDEINASRAASQKVVQTEDSATAAQKAITDGDTSRKAKVSLEKAQRDANDAHIEKQVSDYMSLQKKTDEAIKNIKGSSELTAETKKQRITQLQSHLQDVRNQTYYAQSTVRTNLLFGTGRIADQANKGVQAISDKLTAGARIGANSSFSKSTGRKLFADNATVGEVWDAVRSNPALNQAKTNATIAKRILQAQDAGKGPVASLFRGYSLTGTKLTEAGSRYKIANKDTVSYFTSKAQAEGITEPSKIANYVNDAIGSSEWKRVNNSLFEARNSFTGLPNAGKQAGKNVKLNVRQGIVDKLNGAGLSRNLSENIADGITIPVVGFPKLIARLGGRGLDNATAGVTDFVRAGLIKPKNEADALKKALLVQQGFRSAQTAGTLIPLGVMLGASGMTTGAYPTDPAERARWQREKIQPYSLKLGDQYLDLGRYAGPLAFPLMLAAAVGSGNAGDIPGTAAGITGQFLQNYGADSIGDVMKDAGAILSGDFTTAGKDLNRYGAGMIDAFIPASSALNTSGKAQDIIQGNAAPDGSANVTDALRAKLPVVRDGLPDKTDTLGNPISQGTAVDLLPGVSGGQSTGRAKTNASDDTVNGEINRLSSLKFETMPSKDVKNTNSQSDAKTLIGSSLYKSADDETKAAYLKDTLAGTKTKDINKSLSSDKRSALIQYELQDTDKRKAWLDDNTNAASYYGAAYDNADANKTLTDKDRDITEPTGLKYKAVSAQVDKDYNADYDLKNNYGDTSQSEFNSLLNPKSDTYDPDVATTLYNYDQARVKAGLPPKYNLAKAQKTGAYAAKSGSGTGSDNFTFASLPSSLVGTGSSDSGSKYADAASLFKPIADLQTPKSSSVPERRTISVKKGIVI